MANDLDNSFPQTTVSGFHQSDRAAAAVRTATKGQSKSNGIVDPKQTTNTPTTSKTGSGDYTKTKVFTKPDGSKNAGK